MAADGSKDGASSSEETIEALRTENQALRHGKGLDKEHHRLRSISSWVLIVLACVLAVVSVVVVFTRNQLLNTDAYVRTVAPLASNPAIQDQVAKSVSANLIARTNVQQEVKQALPPKAGFLAAPIASGLQTVTNEVVLRTVQSKQFATFWVSANRISHQQLVNVLTGAKVGSVTTGDGMVTLDLSQVEVQAKKKLDARGITVFDKLPPVKGLNFVLFQSKELARIQRLVKFLNNLAIVLPIITLLCFAAGVVLARNRRRGLTRAATGLALSMALVLVAVAVGRNQYLSSLNASQSVAANSALIAIVTNSLRATVRVILVVAAVLALGSLLAGNAAIRRWVGGRGGPSWLTSGPVHDFVARYRNGIQWGFVALGLLVLVVWSDPTTLVAVIVVLVALALVGLTGLYAGRGPVGPSAALATGHGAATPSPPASGDDAAGR